MSPEQELYDRLYYYSQNELGYDTYDQLPRLDAKYPFVELAETDSSRVDAKVTLSHRISQIVHVWGDETMRLQIDQMINQFILDRVVSDDYVYSLESSEKRILSDASVPNTRLYHGVLTLVFVYMKGKANNG